MLLTREPYGRWVNLEANARQKARISTSTSSNISITHQLYKKPQNKYSFVTKYFPTLITYIHGIFFELRKANYGKGSFKSGIFNLQGGTRRHRFLCRLELVLISSNGYFLIFYFFLLYDTYNCRCILQRGSSIEITNLFIILKPVRVHRVKLEYTSFLILFIT